MKSYTFILLLICVVVCSCDPIAETQTRRDTYIGGEIVNPNTNYVVFSKSNIDQDTIYLNDQNQFLHKIENFEDGLYFFKHKPENQLVFIEKGDSILFRLNTLEFDESLVFSGDGSKKNNFLIDMFLENEKERSDLQIDFRYNPSEFQNIQDSLLERRLKIYKKFKDKNKPSPLAIKITKSSFLYEFYSRYEMYFYRHYGVTEIDSIKDLPASFFDYREKVNFNDGDLKRHYSYNRFLNSYIMNSTYANFAKGHAYIENPLGNTLYELQLIDSIIQHEYIKNNMLRGVARQFILDSKDSVSSREVLNFYLSKSTNQKFRNEINDIANATFKLEPKDFLPDQLVINHEGKETNLQSLFKKPVTAIYFWSVDNKSHFETAHKKILSIQKKYPEIDFIAIHMGAVESNKWKSTIQRHGYDPTHEYTFSNYDTARKELAIYSRNKVILVDDTGKIINANTKLFSALFESTLIRHLILEKNNLITNKKVTKNKR